MISCVPATSALDAHLFFIAAAYGYDHHRRMD